MKSIIRFFIKNEILANLLLVAIVVLGLLSLNNMTSTYFPETESRMLSVRIIYPGASPEEIEEGVISKIEENLKGVTGVERITSTSSENAGSVNVEVFKGYDPDVILEDVKNAVNRINSFPVGMEPAVTYKLENLGRAIDFSLSGDVDLQTLKQSARKVEEDLLSIDGISKVSLSGFPDEEIEVTFREKDLRKYGLTFQEAATAIRNFNLELTGGTLKTDAEELLIRADNKKYTAKELLDVIIKSNSNGGVILLKDVAEIRDKWSDKPSRTFINGKPAVVVNVQNTLEEDMLSVASLVRDYIDRYNAGNSEIKADIILDSSVVLNQRIDLLKENGIIGFILVMVLLAMFLNYRLAFWVALSIPISFAGMFIMANAFGITINVISLFGMILVIGILVDDGIVIAENIYQKYEEGMPPVKAAVEGTYSVFSAVTSAVITTIIAFSAFFFLDGRIGDIFRQMAIVVIFSLVFSLIEGMLTLPAHVAHSKALSHGGNKNKFNEILEKFLTKIRETLYMPLLRASIDWPIPTLAAIVAVFFLIIGAFQGGLIKGTFFPNLPRDNFYVDLKLPAGTREAHTLELLNKIERSANEANDSLSQAYYQGAFKPIIKIQKDLGPTTYEGRLDMTMLDGETRGALEAREIMNAIREKVGPIYEAESLTYYSGSPFGKPVSIALLGKDKDELLRAVEAVKSEMSRIPDLKDIVDNNQEGLKEVNVKLKQEAYNLGFTIREVVSQVRQGFFGSEVQRLQRGRDEVKVWVRYSESDRSDLVMLADMRITNTRGLTVPLSQIADFDIGRGIVNIYHIDGQREVRVECDVASDNASISDINADLRNVLIPQVLNSFPGVKVGYEGQVREQAKTAASFKKVLPLVFLLMFFMVVITFKSVSQSLILFATIPFGFIGVGFGHYMVDLPISFFSVLGMIALIGVMVNDGLVFISTFNEKIHEGLTFRDAVLTTGASRFRPIILTSITTIAGLAPLLLEKSFQAQFLIPMAVSVAFGLVVSTYLMLVMIPSLLFLSNRIKRYSLSYWNGMELTNEEVEPAYPNRKQNVPIYLIAAILALVIFVVLVFLMMKAGQWLV